MYTTAKVLPGNKLEIQTPNLLVGQTVEVIILVPENGYYETVLKLTLDPTNNPSYKTAVFDVEYDGNPLGISVNIGDSKKNDGRGGDAGNQSNDAEMQIGVNHFIFPMNDSGQNDLLVFGNDYYTPQKNEDQLLSVYDLVSNGTKITLKVSNKLLEWDNHSGASGHLFSPYLYALAGQPVFTSSD